MKGLVWFLAGLTLIASAFVAYLMLELHGINKQPFEVSELKLLFYPLSSILLRELYEKIK